jgi:predicted metal-dependent peptidase
MSAAQKISDAKTALVMKQPFYGLGALSMEYVEDPSVGTAATDGRKIYYAPEYIDSLSRDELQFVIAHEVKHVYDMHHLRRGTRDLERWNHATDYKINEVLAEDGMIPPEGVLLDARYAGLTSEATYDLLTQEQQQEPNNKDQKDKSDKGSSGPSDGTDKPDDSDGAPDPDSAGNGQGEGKPDLGIGGVLDMPNEDGSEMSEAEREQEAKRIETVIAQAEQFAKSAGMQSAGSRRAFGALFRADVPWYEELREFFHKEYMSDYTFALPDPMTRHLGIYLPDVEYENFGVVVVAIDTSGSISEKMLTRYASEINAIKDEIQPAETHVIYCDVNVKRHDVFVNGESVVLEMIGGGGTRFAPVFEFLEANRVKPDAFVYFTDLENTSEDKRIMQTIRPDYPVLWASTNFDTSIAGPFGKTINCRV